MRLTGAGGAGHDSHEPWQRSYFLRIELHDSTRHCFSTNNASNSEQFVFFLS